MVTMKPSAAHLVLVGLDGQRVEGTATDRINPAMATDSAVVERAAGGEQRFMGLFVQDAAQVTQRLGATAAIRMDVWQSRDGGRRVTRSNDAVETTDFADRSDIEISPRVGVIYRASNELALRGSVYRAFRAPTLNELYRPFQVGTVMTAANENLSTESLWGSEGGLQLAVGPLVARATGFYNRMSDPVFNVTVPADDGSTARMRQNLDRARVGGLELDAAWRAERWSTSVAYTFMDAVVTAAADHRDLIGRRLAQVPHHRATATVAFDDPRLATIAVDLRYTSRQFEDDLNTLSMGAYVVVDAFARRRIARGLSAFVTGQNLFDADYLVGRSGVDTVGAPRTLLGGISYESR
jgi:iron complex outermembrane recepter protein